MKYRFIAIEGNIGAGKSTLAGLLAQHYDAELILEEFADNNFLPKFYHDPERYAFPLELSFLADRYKQLKSTLLPPQLFPKKVVADYLFIKSKLFAKLNLNVGEYELFEKLFDIADPHLPSPDLLIYLHCPIEKLQSNIRKRGRVYEQEISDDYLKSVEEVYLQYLKQKAQKALVIDTTHIDFIKEPDHFSRLVRVLEEDSHFTAHSMWP